MYIRLVIPDNMVVIIGLKKMIFPVVFGDIQTIFVNKIINF